MAALLIKVDATGDSKENQELLGALLVLVLVAGPVIIALQFAHATASEVLDTVREHKNSAKSGSGKELPPEETDALNKFELKVSLHPLWENERNPNPFLSLTCSF